MYNKSKYLPVAFALSVFSIDASASYVKATPSKINLNESVTIDWSRYYPNRFPNQTYNLYVYKPNGQPKYKYRRGISSMRDVRGPNTISGLQTIEVEVCDQYGQNCFTSSRGRVSFNVDHQCEFEVSNNKGAYYCNGTQVTQYATYQPWPLGVNDSMSEFISIKNRVYWLYTNRINNYTTEYAWYTNCRSGGNVERVTELVRNTSFGSGGESFDRIDDFVPLHNNDTAVWSYYDSFSKKSYARSASFSKCN